VTIRTRTVFIAVLAAAALALLTSTLAMATADPAGVWEGTSTDDQGNSYDLTMTLKHDGDTWTGDIQVNDQDVPLQDLKVTDTTISFTTAVGGGSYHVEGTIDSDTMKGTYDGDASGTFTLKKRSAAPSTPNEPAPPTTPTAPTEPPL
jgi:hypothetical protein